MAFARDSWIDGFLAAAYLLTGRDGWEERRDEYLAQARMEYDLTTQDYSEIARNE